MSDLPRVSVVCLSYNRPHLLGDALAGLAGQTYPNLDVTVIDNRSPRSEEVAAVAGRYPQFEFVPNPENSGFTGGMNLGIRRATGEFICLTEDDLFLEPDFVAALVDYFAARPDTGLAGGLLIDRGTRTILCAGADYQLGRVFRFRFRAEGEPDAGQFSGPFEAPFVSGSVIFARRDFLAGELNGFRDDFFVYLEDLELCHRTRRANRSVVVVPRARAHHATPPPGRVSALVEYHKYKNLYAVYFLHAPAKVLPVFLLRYGPWALLKALARGRFRDFWIQVQAWAHALGRVPSLLSERRKRPPVAIAHPTA
jgi:GT2 family glycosyltransferase